MDEATSTPDFIKTNDMGMVSYFRMKGFTHKDTEWRGPSCYWIFDHSPGLAELFERWIDGEAREDLKEYNKFYGMVKKEFFQTKQG